MCKRPLKRFLPLLSLLGIALVVVPAIGAEPTSSSVSRPADKPNHPSLDNILPYQPQGATSTPKVDAHWDRYHDYTAATHLLSELAKAYPDRAKLTSLGKSYGNRQMWVLTVTNFKTPTAETDKPAFWIDGGIHANEIQASEVVLYTAWYLLEMYDRSPMVRRLLDERTFYLMPMMSPDSRDAHFYEPNSTHSPRPASGRSAMPAMAPCGATIRATIWITTATSPKCVSAIRTAVGSPTLNFPSA